MFCQHCGNQITPDSKFCATCGKPAAPLVPHAAPADPRMTLESKIHLLGVLWVIYGGFHILSAFWIAAFSRFFIPAMEQIMAQGADSGRNIHIALGPFWHFMSMIYIGSAIYAVIAGAVGIFAGVAFLRRESNGRTLGIIAAALSLISFPFGTALGVYTLVVLLSHEVRQGYQRLSPAS
jgi:hypothetical protein